MSHPVSISRRHFLGYAGSSIAFAGELTSSAEAKSSFKQTRANVAAIVKGILASTDVPSLAYALIGRQGVIWSESVGVIDKLTGTSPGADTLYCIGSCSKVFAVAAVMKLVEQSLIDLDRPYVKYVPQFRMLSEDAKDITVRMLMNHSSGLPGCEYRGLESIRWHGNYAEAVLATVAKSRLKHKPGELSVYCNDGFTLLEPLVKAVTGTPFADFMQREILQPLGMNKSQYGNAPIPSGAYAPAYDGDRQLPLNILNSAASGGLYTTPSEWGRFMAIFLNDGRFGEAQILTPDSIRQMAENQSAGQPFRPFAIEGFGLGWDSVNPTSLNALGLTAWRKNGGTTCYTSDMIVAPDAGLAVVVTAAAGGFDVSALSEQLLLEGLVEQHTLSTLPPALESVVAPVVETKVDAAWFDGAFATNMKLLRFEANPAGTVTHYQAENGVWNKVLEGLRPRSDGYLATDSRPEVSFRLLDYQGFTFLTQKSLAGYKSHVSEMVGAQKLRSQGPLSPAWKNRLGKRWLVVNQPEDDYLPGMNGPAMQMSELPGLEGYVVLHFGPDGQAMNQVVDPRDDDYVGRMCLKIPFGGSRDLNDVILETRKDGEWLHYGSWLGRPLETVPVIGLGTHEVRIEAQGAAEWRKLAAVAGLDIIGATTWNLNATDLRPLANGSGDVKGLGDETAGYVAVYGTPGSIITLTLS